MGAFGRYEDPRTPSHACLRPILNLRVLYFRPELTPKSESNNVVAPAFQNLFIAPDQDSDGVAYSHELLSYDLRGVDVLTSLN